MIGRNSSDAGPIITSQGGGNLMTTKRASTSGAAVTKLRKSEEDPKLTIYEWRYMDFSTGEGPFSGRLHDAHQDLAA